MYGYLINKIKDRRPCIYNYCNKTDTFEYIFYSLVWMIFGIAGATGGQI